MGGLDPRIHRSTATRVQDDGIAAKAGCFHLIILSLLTSGTPGFGVKPGNHRTDRCKTAMIDNPLADPLAWRGVVAPSLVALEVLAAEAFRKLPAKFRALCDGLVIQVEDFPSEDVLEAMELDSEFDLLGLFQGTGLPFRSDSAPVQMPNMIWLYRRPILDYWAEHEDTFGAIVTHVLVHEIGHHFGLSDDDMYALEREAG
jgi:predicted Zn-dependent protease with MMP-like domain